MDPNYIGSFGSNPNRYNTNRTKINPMICENKEFLCNLAFTRSERKRRQLLKKASIDQLLSLAEIALNIVRSRFHLTTRQKKRLLPYADFVRRLSRARSEKGARRILIPQRGEGIGSFLSALLTPILIELGRELMIKGNN